MCLFHSYRADNNKKAIAFLLLSEKLQHNGLEKQVAKGGNDYGKAKGVTKGVRYLCF